MFDLVDRTTGITYSWNGSHTVNVIVRGVEVDCFTFGLNGEGTKPSVLEFLVTTAELIKEVNA